MARVVIYRLPVRAADQAEAQPRFGGPAAPSVGAGMSPTPPVDDYKDKLVKFVPAEVIAFFAPIASLVQDRPGLLITAASLGLVATPTYLWTSSRSLTPTQRPPLHNYVLSALAFAVWAVATSHLGTMVGLDPVAKAFTLGATVFLIPLVDSVLARHALTA